MEVSSDTLWSENTQKRAGKQASQRNIKYVGQGSQSSLMILDAWLETPE